jgi:Txe/YoeB family toxin of Txe-Axe toxin-antitoxin module
METTMFTLGVLSIILAALVATVVYGIVTVLKLKTETTEIWRRIDENHRDVHLHYDRKFEDMQRDVNMIEATIMNQIQHATTHSTSYTDKRIDKLVDTYFEVQSIKKQILKD